MDNFVSTEHIRDSSGNVIVEPAGKTISRMREKQRGKNFMFGVIISALALTVLLTGTALGITNSHANNLRNELANVRKQNAQVTPTTQRSTYTTPTDYNNITPTPLPALSTVDRYGNNLTSNNDYQTRMSRRAANRYNRQNNRTYNRTYDQTYNTTDTTYPKTEPYTYNNTTTPSQRNQITTIRSNM